LKTLEEPPPHVVFVLATTDPHKVMPTIRSRTQHLEFRLYNGETLSSLLRDVGHAAGLSADDATIEAAVRLGRGSARDALSALDQLIATGSVIENQPEFDGLFRALVDADAVAALRCLAVLTREGWDPEQLAENFAAEVRQVFLLQVAPEVADAVGNDRERLTKWGSQLGLPRTVRILETVGRAMREMKSAPEKIVILEVAMVRLIRPELDHSIDALDERVTKLEREGIRVETPAPAPPVVLRPIGTSTPPVKEPAPAPVADVVESDPPKLGGNAAALDIEDVRARFVERVIPRTSRGAQLLLKSAFVRSIDGPNLTIALPSEEMRQNTEMIAQGLKSAMEHEFKSPLHITWAVDPTLVIVSTGPAATPHTIGTRDIETDETYPQDETVIVVDSAGEHLITEMFPGATEVT
jgi:DNA polymerase III gamma/tau subunit